LGISYRSAITYTLDGTVSFTNRPALLAGSALLADGPVTLAIKMPDSASFSLVKKLSDQWTLLGDLTWTGWSSFEKLEVIRSSGVTLLSVDEQWKDTYRVSLGANYSLSDRVMLRGGLAFDQTPVRNEHRTARIPDNDRTWIAFGAKFMMSPTTWIDAGYSHLFIKDASILDNQTATAKGSLIGNYTGSIDIASVQLTVTF
jgi:long-chain fatty acid transport protein